MLGATISRAGACLAAVATASLAGGCGSGSHSTSKSGAGPLTVRQATAIANAVNLTSADLPGYTGTPHQPTSASKLSRAQVAACVGGVDPARGIVKIDSDRFSRGSGLQLMQAESSVTVLPSASLAAQDLAAYNDAKARSCLARYLSQALIHASPSSITYGVPVISRISTPPGARDGSFGYRLVIPVAASGVRLQIYSDFLGFRSGPTEIGLDTTRIGQAFQRGEEARLYSLLVARANVHSA